MLDVRVPLNWLKIKRNSRWLFLGVSVVRLFDFIFWFCWRRCFVLTLYELDDSFHYTFLNGTRKIVFLCINFEWLNENKKQFIKKRKKEKNKSSMPKWMKHSNFFSSPVTAKFLDFFYHFSLLIALGGRHNRDGVCFMVSAKRCCCRCNGRYWLIVIFNSSFLLFDNQFQLNARYFYSACLMAYATGGILSQSKMKNNVFAINLREYDFPLCPGPSISSPPSYSFIFSLVIRTKDSSFEFYFSPPLLLWWWWLLILFHATLTYFLPSNRLEFNSEMQK